MQKPLWWIKLKFEYWPWWGVYVLMIPVLLWQIARTRCITFFTTLNPGMDDSAGFSGTSKSHIMSHFPAQLRPAEVLVPARSTPDEALHMMRAAGIDFPAVAKPDAGERGILVCKMDSPEDLAHFMRQFSKSFQIQAFIPFSLEFAVFYVRYPGQKTGKITSITAKQFLSVAGDGHSSIRELMMQTDRARLQIARLEAQSPELLREVPAPGETRLLEPVGSHNRGTAFVDASHLISPAMHQAFDALADHFPGFHYGRYDLKVQSPEDLTTFNHLKIMELNGVVGEPAHIYDPAGNWWRACRVMARHWHIAADIAILQMRAGVKPLPVKELLRRVQKHMRTRHIGHEMG